MSFSNTIQYILIRKIVEHELCVLRFCNSLSGPGIRFGFLFEFAEPVDGSVDHYSAHPCFPGMTPCYPDAFKPIQFVINFQKPSFSTSTVSSWIVTVLTYSISKSHKIFIERFWLSRSCRIQPSIILYSELPQAGCSLPSANITKNLWITVFTGMLMVW